MKRKWIALLVMVALMGSLFGCRQEIPEGSVYREACEKAVAQMAKDEQNGKSPATAAKVALKLAGKKNPPQHNVVGGDYQLLALGIKLLPAALVEKVMGMIYCK